mmetsp:Transcript_89101/g.288124  ORF Transcript_89101/g.288124 Transcript_89101/m.288124 type:complete len:300 (-) Transcript_89101:64-963(-)
MLKFTVVAPDKRKVELECEPSSTFQQVKSMIEAQTSVPVDKQRLLCNGKERKNGAETLAAAGLKPNAKLMLMLAPGYTMPLAPGAPLAADADDAMAAAPAEEEAPAVELSGELPLPSGAEPSASPGVVNVRQGRNRYHVRVPQGLAAATFGDLAAFLAGSLLPPGVPPSECRFICRGKSAEHADTLAVGAATDLSVMLMFREGFHLAAEGADWLRSYSVELTEAEAKIEKLAKRIEANFGDGAETSLRLAEVGGLVETLKQSVESVRVRETQLEEMRQFRDRVLAADARLEVLRKSIRI